MDINSTFPHHFMLGDFQEDIVDTESASEGEIDFELAASGSSSNEFFDSPDLIDIDSLKTFLKEEPETTPEESEVDRIVNNLINDDEFEKECEQYYQVNSQLDHEISKINPIVQGRGGVQNFQKELYESCPLCDRSKYRDHHQLLLKHLEDKHDMVGQKYLCPFCTFSDEKLQVVREHALIVHKLTRDVIRCATCYFATYRPDIFKQHCLTHHNPDEKFDCIVPNCNYTAMSEKYFNLHLREQHKFNLDGDDSLPCKGCNGYIMGSLADLKKHQKFLCVKRVIKKAHVYKCRHCEFRADNMIKVNRHIWNEHGKTQFYNCKYCKFKTNKSNVLTLHLAAVHNEN